MEIQKLDRIIGRKSKNLIESASDNSTNGAIAALETFYYSFNNKDINTFKQIWVNHDLIQLNNPVGGIIRGINDIYNLYSNIFKGNAEVWVEFHDIVIYKFEECVVFAGREQGQFIKNNQNIDLAIRTSRIFAYSNGLWGQVHHHGSIDNPELLKKYQDAVKL
jgi:hypothetical protein